MSTAVKIKQTVDQVTEQVKTFIELETRKRELKEELERLEAEKAEIEQSLLKHFEESGIQKVSMNGMTVYLHRQIWASAKEGNKEALCNALKKSPLKDLVYITYNSNKLSAIVREYESEGKSLPRSIADLIEVTEQFSIRLRKSWRQELCLYRHE